MEYFIVLAKPEIDYVDFVKDTALLLGQAGMITRFGVKDTTPSHRIAHLHYQQFPLQKYYDLLPIMNKPYFKLHSMVSGSIKCEKVENNLFQLRDKSPRKHGSTIVLANVDVANHMLKMMDNSGETYAMDNRTLVPGQGIVCYQGNRVLFMNEFEELAIDVYSNTASSTSLMPGARPAIEYLEDKIQEKLISNHGFFWLK